MTPLLPQNQTQNVMYQFDVSFLFSGWLVHVHEHLYKTNLQCKIMITALFSYKS